jgi:MinD superfamily P-loop ATPase
MEEIVVISGKGGTGKTSMTAAFAYYAKDDVIVADCDVDAADMHLLLQPDFSNKEDFYSGLKAIINQDKCTQCGKCYSICKFDAISKNEQSYEINTLDCEGCGYCEKICEAKAITMHKQMAGKSYISAIKTGNKMVHAHLNIGADNSGKLVAKVKKDAKAIAKKENKEIILIDGSPGIGCPVVSSLSGSNYVILVTEPSVSGLHDLKRVYELVKKFKIKAGCIINKSDINKDYNKKIHSFIKTENISLIAEIPYNETFTKAMLEGKTIMEVNDLNLIEIIKSSWTKINQQIHIQ